MTTSPLQVDAVTTALDAQVNTSTPGLQYQVFTNDDILFQHYAGYQHLSERMTETQPMTRETMLLSNSCTKAVTALAVLQLVDSGKVALDTAVEHYCSDFPYGPHITVRHLITHTSGIPFSNRHSARMWHTVEQHAAFDDKRELQKVQDKYAPAQNVPQSKVGQKYNYNNLGFWWLGRLIAQVSGMKYTEYVKQHVFEPLGITELELSFDMPPDNRYCDGYIKFWHPLNLVFRRLICDSAMFTSSTTDGWLAVKEHYHHCTPGGGVIASADGYRKLVQDLLRNDSKLLSKELKLQMLSQQYFANGKDVKKEALGWEICSVKGPDGTPHKYYSRSGGWMGWRSEIRMYPDAGVGSVLLGNSTHLETQDVLNQVDVIVLQQMSKR